MDGVMRTILGFCWLVLVGWVDGWLFLSPAGFYYWKVDGGHVLGMMELE